MRIELREVTIYKFDELGEKKQQALIQDTLEFIYDNQDYMKGKIDNLEERIKKVEKRTEEMQTPWFFNNFIFDEFKDEVMRFLNEDEYYEDGSVA